MNDKIFRAIWTAGITVLLASLIFIMGVSYSYFSSVQKKQLRIETALAAQGVALSGMDFFDELESNDYRITWIASDGTVLYDNEADSKTMQNHLEREEVKQAIVEGYGQSSRRSYTLADQQYYAAQKLTDGTILRMSITQLSVWSLLLGFAQPICFVALIALVLSYFLASRLTSRIIKPINEINIDHPAEYFGREEYKEVEPLLKRIQSQKQQIRSDQKEIERTALIRQEFTANVSHELKTPLHAISGYAELLENGMVSDTDVRPFAGKIRNESMRMTNLVEDIIELTRLDNGAQGISWEDCDLYRIAENAIDSLEVVASASDVSIHLDGSSAQIQGVPKLLYSIIYNLCENAIKYNHKEGSVSVLLSQQSNHISLNVTDTGIGISKDEIDRIFERFYRVDKSRSKEVGGTGLGLSIVKHAVLIHGGKITVESTPGVGSSFTVTIPKVHSSKSE